MKRPLIAAVLSFLVAALMGTGVVLLRAPAAAAAGTAETMADIAANTATDTAVSSIAPASDSASDGKEPVAPASQAAPADIRPSTETPAPLVPPKATALPTPSATTAATPTRPTAGARDEEDAAAERAARSGRLTKLFVAMSPREAAKVLEQMVDADVITILRGLPARRAGEILALMSPTRSAELARQMLAPEATRP